VHHKRRGDRIPESRNRVAPHHRAPAHRKANLLSVACAAELFDCRIDQRLRVPDRRLVGVASNARLDQPSH
jgi:hypothetical protein